MCNSCKIKISLHCIALNTFQHIFGTVGHLTIKTGSAKTSDLEQHLVEGPVAQKRRGSDHCPLSWTPPEGGVLSDQLLLDAQREHAVIKCLDEECGDCPIVFYTHRSE